MSDFTSYASMPGMLRIDQEKWNNMIKFMKLKPSKQRKLEAKKEMIAEHLFEGDCQPAIVVSVNPLIIASYSDEFDAVVMLEFPCEYQEKYNLKVDDRLVTINGYFKSIFGVAKDIHVGYKYLHRWTNVCPTVGLFMSSNTERLEILANNIPEELWEYTRQLAKDYVEKYPKVTRKGFWFL